LASVAGALAAGGARSSSSRISRIGTGGARGVWGMLSEVRARLF